MGDERAELAARAAEHVRYWQEAGVRRLAVPETPVAPPVGASGRPSPEASEPSKPAETTSAASPGNAAAVLAQVETDLSGCTRCDLCHGRTHIVFGVGNPKADVVFVGEAPGRDEDLRGEPFVGRAGQLLTDIIERGMGIPRASVYICNTVKCRPPGNRNPLPAELASCEPFLVRQLMAIRPKVIVAMGKFAAQALCRSEVPISRLRGTWYTYEGIAVMPTYHPAYLLRNPSAKREVWDDIQQVMARIGLPVKGGK